MLDVKFTNSELWLIERYVGFPYFGAGKDSLHFFDQNEKLQFSQKVANAKGKFKTSFITDEFDSIIKKLK